MTRESIIGSLRVHELDAPDYHGHHALSFSQLHRCGLWTEDELQWTPHLFASKIECTDAMDKGVLTHASHYEPRKYQEMYAIRPVTDSGRLVADNTKQYAAWAAENEGKTHVSPKEHADIEGMIGAMSGSAYLSRYRANRELISTETAYCCVDPATGLEIRIKPDELRFGSGGYLINGDMKTTRAKNPAEFQHECQPYKLAYYRRYAFYRRALSIITGLPAESIRSLMLCVTNTPPHIFYPVELDPAKLDFAETQNDDAMKALAECIESGIFMPSWMKEAVIL